LRDPLELKLSAEPKISPEIAFISLGSNISPEENLPLAIQRMHALGYILAVSRVYQNAAIERTDQPDFLNAAVKLETNHSAWELRTLLRGIEAGLGRIRSENKFAPRTIDLDLCMLGKQRINDPQFTLPDPDLLRRPHLAVPMAELDPEFIHPETGETLQEIAQRLMPQAEMTVREDVSAEVKKLAVPPPTPT
jgi:2-amino-4-hydroxy-6-hydroxymethyldihydropteridine diphosphokinase